jgi:hypothetical protein
MHLTGGEEHNSPNVTQSTIRVKTGSQAIPDFWNVPPSLLCSSWEKRAPQAWSSSLATCFKMWHGNSLAFSHFLSASDGGAWHTEHRAITQHPITFSASCCRFLAGHRKSQVLPSSLQSIFHLPLIFMAWVFSASSVITQLLHVLVHND